jgi:hypothetical protein
MTNSVAIYKLIVGLICGFAQAARGQQSDPVQPPPETMVGGTQGSTGGPSESDVATANNPIAPMNALYFQNHYAPTWGENFSILVSKGSPNPFVLFAKRS